MIAELILSLFLQGPGSGLAEDTPDDPLVCLSQAVYFEARGEPLEGQKAVAEAVLERVRRPEFPSTICGVVKQPSHDPDRPLACQFSYTCRNNPSMFAPEPIYVWMQAVLVASDAIRGPPPKEGVRPAHFLRCDIMHKVGWAREMHLYEKIGNHCFLTEEKPSPPENNEEEVLLGKCIEKLPHSCGTRAGLQVFQDEEGKYNGYCFNCGVVVDDPYKDKPDGYEPPEPEDKDPQAIANELAEIESDYPVVALPDRKLMEVYLAKSKYRIGVSRQDGQTPELLYRPYFTFDNPNSPSAYKVKVIENKATWTVGSMKDIAPFGWHEAVEAGGRVLFITEGEEDKVALEQVLKEANKGTKYEKYDPSVVSLPFGAGSAARYLSRIAPRIRKEFKEICLVFDMDAAGRKAASEVCKEVFPDAQVAELPAKDPNDCLKEGRSKALMKAVMFKAEKPKNTRLVWGEDIHEQAKKAAEWGVSWPWKGLTELTRGIRTGETIYIGAGQKMGKSELVDAIGGHLISEHDWAIMMAKPEQANQKTYKKLAGKMVGKVFDDPKIPFDEEAYEKAGEILKDHLAMLNLYQHLGWTSLQQDIRDAAAQGIKAVFVDPVTNVTNGMAAGDANAKLQEVAQELASMALDLDIVIFIMCHLRNPDGGPEHTRGGEVLSSQFAGSRAMARSCNYMLGLQGDKDPSLPDEQRNMRELVLLEDREFGEAGSVHLYWDRKTTWFNEVG